MNSFSLVLAELGNELGLPELALDAQGGCMLAFDSVVVNFELIGDGQLLLIHTCLGQAPDQPSANFYAQLLEANHFFAATGGATIGLHSASRSIDLAMVREIQSLDYPSFTHALEGFVHVAEYWCKQISAPTKQDGTDTASTDKELALHPLHMRA